MVCECGVTSYPPARVALKTEVGRGNNYTILCGLKSSDQICRVGVGRGGFPVVLVVWEAGDSHLVLTFNCGLQS